MDDLIDSYKKSGFISVLPWYFSFRCGECVYYKNGCSIEVDYKVDDKTFACKYFEEVEK